jgi:hypothetical protein
LIPKPLKPALVDHLVEFFPVRVKFEASLADFVLLNLNVDRRQVAVEDQDSDPIGEALHFLHRLSGIGY